MFIPDTSAGAYKSLLIQILISFAGSGYIGYIDDIQLIKGDQGNRHNYIVDGWFEKGATHPWNRVNCGSSDGIVEVADPYAYKEFLGGKALKLSANPAIEKSWSRTIATKGNAGDQFLLNVFGKGNMTKNDDFGVSLSIHYPESDETKAYQFRFSPDYESWQILTKGVAAERVYDRVTFTLFSRCGSDVYFEAAQLYRDAFGTQYAYNERMDLTSMVQPDGTSAEIDYDQDGKVAKAIDGSGVVYHYKYNEDCTVSEIETSLGSKLRFVYQDGKCTETEMTTSNGKAFKTSRDYDEKGNVVSETDECGNATTFHYDDLGRQTGMALPSGMTENYFYNPLGQLSAILRLASGQSSSSHYEYDGKGNLSKITTDNGSVYSFNYDVNQRIVKVTLGNQALVSTEFGQSVGGVSLDLPTRQTLGDDATSGYYDFLYDSKFRLSQVKFNGTLQAEYAYDENDRVTCVYDAINKSKEYLDYNSKGNIANRKIVWENGVGHVNNAFHYVLDNLQNLQRSDALVFGERQAMDYEHPCEFSECTPTGYFSRLGRTYPEETILGIQGLKGTFGAKPAVDTTKDDGQTMTAGKIPSISFETDNATAIYHVNTLNSKRKTAQNDWKANLNVKRVAYGWIKPTGAINAKQRIFAFGTEAHNAPRFSLVIEADGRASVYDSFHSQNALVTTFVAVTKNAWNFVGMQFSSSGNTITATVTMNGEVYNTTYTNIGNFASLTRFHIGEPSPSLTIADLYKLDRGEAVNKPYPPRMPFRFSFAAVGSRIYNAAEFRGIYREGKKVLFGEPILSASGATWINPKPFNGMDIIPLNGSFSSLNRRQPKELNYTDPSFKAGKPKNFEWDPDLKRHVYGSYGTYLVLAPGNKSKLVYDLMLKNKGTISIRFKVKGSTPNERTILAFRNGSTNALKFSISSGKLRITQGTTDLSFVQQSVASDVWHWLAFRWDGTSYRVAFDDYATSRTASAPIDVTGCVTSVGCDLDTLGNPTKHLDGSIETLAFTESPFTNAWVSMLKDATPSSTRTYFDEVGRPTVKEIVDSGNTLRKSYIYKTNGAFDTTRIEREVNFLDQTILYGYDAMGNVTSVSYSGGTNAAALPKSKTYTYDSFGRLVSSKHGTTNHGYSYDKDGNILVKDGVTYTYDAAFKGRLRSRSDNTFLEYNDALPSNPTYIRKPGKAFALSWEGRRLKSAAGTTYEYNPEGIRIAKHAQNYDEYYALEGKQIAGLKRVEGGSETIALFRYDERGILTGFSLNGDEYFYERNILGDITAVLDSNGHPVIAYDYDDWGVPTVKTIDSAKGYFVSKISRFLFKGYFHDEETGFYYLESRYYDPELARFISTDEASNLDPRAPTGMNPWAYCQNDPVNKFDPSGRFGLVIGLIGSFFVGFAVSVVSQGIQYGEVNWLQAGTDALFTVVSAALAYTGIGLLASTVINAGMGFAQYTLNATVFHDDFTWEGAAIATIWGAVAGYVGGEGAKNSASIKKHLDNAGRTSLKAIRTALKNHGTGTKFQRTLNLYAKRLAQSITKSISRAYTVSVLKIWKVSAFGLLIVSSIAFLNWIANMALTSINRN